MKRHDLNDCTYPVKNIKEASKKITENVSEVEQEIQTENKLRLRSRSGLVIFCLQIRFAIEREF